MSNHQYTITLRCHNCEEELESHEVATDIDAGVTCLFRPVDVESIRLAFVASMAKHEYDSHCMGASHD